MLVMVVRTREGEEGRIGGGEGGERSEGETRGRGRIWRGSTRRMTRLEEKDEIRGRDYGVKRESMVLNTERTL
jgi:hypothetical protein